MTSRAVLFAMALVLGGVASAGGPAVRLYAAGSLRGAMTEIIQAYVANGGEAVEPMYGASGLLRERIEEGETAHVFASADMGNPQALARSGRAAAPVVFARNRLCALVAPEVDVTSESLLDRILDPAIKLGTSTPKADPSGDYAWVLFEKAEVQRPGAYRTLDTKALKLTGGPKDRGTSSGSRRSRSAASATERRARAIGSPACGRRDTRPRPAPLNANQQEAEYGRSRAQSSAPGTVPGAGHASR